MYMGFSFLAPVENEKAPHRSVANNGEPIEMGLGCG
jgi:hypothetical protein